MPTNSRLDEVDPHRPPPPYTILDSSYMGLAGLARMKAENGSYSGPHASHPGMLSLSFDKLKLVYPQAFPGLIPGKRWTRWLFGPSMAEVEYLQFWLNGGDSRAALVVSTSPVLVSVYTDEMDCTCLYRFPDEYAGWFSLRRGQRLLAVLTFGYGKKLVRDLENGPRACYRYANFQALIGDFRSDDVERLEERKQTLEPDEWPRCVAMTKAYLRQFGHAARDGRLPYVSDPANIDRAPETA